MEFENNINAKLNGLRKFNAVMACFHLAQGLVLFLLSTNFSLPVMSYFLEMDPIRNKLTPVPEAVSYTHLTLPTIYSV